MTPNRAAACGLCLAAGMLAASAARAELLPISCEDGASVVLTYADSSPEFEERSELGECGPSAIGDWNRVGFADETDAATVSAVGLVRSEDGFTLEVSNELSLDVDDLASIVVLAEGEARFRSPEADEDIPAEVIVEILRSGELDEEELSLAVIGPGVDVFEDLDGEPDGELRFAVELEPDEEYRAVLIAASELSDTATGSHTLRARIETTPVPEPAAALLLAAGALALTARRLSTMGRPQSRALEPPRPARPERRCGFA